MSIIMYNIIDDNHSDDPLRPGRKIWNLILGQLLGYVSELECLDHLFPAFPSVRHPTLRLSRDTDLANDRTRVEAARTSSRYSSSSRRGPGSSRSNRVTPYRRSHNWFIDSGSRYFGCEWPSGIIQIGRIVLSNCSIFGVRKRKTCIPADVKVLITGNDAAERNRSGECCTYTSRCVHL